MSDPYRRVPTDPVCPLCAHEWRRHDPDDGCCDAHAEEGFGACPCGRNRPWMVGRIAHLSRLFLMSEPAGERTALSAWLAAAPLSDDEIKDVDEPKGGRTGPTTFQWLIERGQPESVAPTVWLEHSAAHPATHRAWTTNAHDAAMFPDRETAERYIADEGLDARAVEHGFMGERTGPTAAEYALLVEIALLAWKATGGTPGIDPTDAWNDLCYLLERQDDSFPAALVALADGQEGTS